jgi:hypothetical protein
VSAAAELIGLEHGTYLGHGATCCSIARQAASTSIVKQIALQSASLKQTFADQQKDIDRFAVLASAAISQCYKSGMLPSLT